MLELIVHKTGMGWVHRNATNLTVNASCVPGDERIFAGGEAQPRRFTAEYLLPASLGRRRKRQAGVPDRLQQQSLTGRTRRMKFGHLICDGCA